MIRLVIGGAYQGKRDFAERTWRLQKAAFADGGALTKEAYKQSAAVDRLHLFIRRLLEDGEKPDEIIGFVAEHMAGKTILCDDICSGIIPLDPGESLWRETTGRTLCAAVRAANTVVRVQCGLAQVLKGVL